VSTQVDERQTKNVLVVGGAGYIGSVLVRNLLGKEYNVRLLDLLLYGDESIRGLYGHPHFELVKGDFRHVDAVVNCMKNIDAVVHLGAIVGDPACTVDEKTTIEVNLTATRMIAEAAKALKVRRFIFTSSCSVYGASDQLLNEQSTLNPISLYAKTKVGSERVLQAINDDSFSPVILRFPTVHGLSYRPRFDLVVNLLIAKAIVDGEILILGGEQWRPFIHVEDAAVAVVKILEAPTDNIEGEIFNVGSDEQNYQISQIGNIVQKLIPHTKVIHQKEATDNRNYYVSFNRIKRRLNFIPRKTVRDSVVEIKEAMRSGKISHYDDPKYNNYIFLNSQPGAKIKPLDVIES